MTAPIDPRPYAAPTDLVTAADVARWLREWRSTATDAEMIAAVDWVHAYDVQDLRNAHDLAQELASQALDARLDRERRQACRRGALYHWRVFAEMTRMYQDRGDSPLTDGDRRLLAAGRDLRREALAFRAAAKPPKETP